MQWADGKLRCHWVSPTNTTYLRYHDDEWGRPVHDDHMLFEMLILENFQAGLTWECVLNKREAFRRAFDEFDLRKVASYSEEKLTALQADSGIIRNRLKYELQWSTHKCFKRYSKSGAVLTDTYGIGQMKKSSEK